MKVGVLHPGSMGSAVGAAIVAGGNECWWASDGRSQASCARAESAGLRDAETLETLAETCGTVLSICPPEFALETATKVVQAGFRGLYVDANAVSPATAREVATYVTGEGCRFVDGGIVGGPPRGAGGRTRLYLSGADSPAVAKLFQGTALDTVVIEGGEGAASALKMAYAAWTKGTSALILNVRALARAEGVEEVLLSEWATSQPDLEERSQRAASGSAPKAWRWVGEMEEIGDAFADAGLPDSFHRGAAQIYQRMRAFKDQGGVTFEDVARTLLEGNTPGND